MMSMSSNAEFSIPVTTLQYREISTGALRDGEPLLGGMQNDLEFGARRKDLQLTHAEFAEQIARERAEAISEMEQKLRVEYERKLLAARAPIATAVAKFGEERDKYFGRVEAEIVQLSLAIAAKILHREAQVDQMLVASLVRVAMENMREGSNVTIRVGPSKGDSWERYFASVSGATRVEVVEDAELNDQDCMVETELGSANFSLEKQLKEVEQGFFDLLAVRPASE
jgi:flagellar assembly protein FliH